MKHLPLQNPISSPRVIPLMSFARGAKAICTEVNYGGSSVEILISKSLRSRLGICFLRRKKDCVPPANTEDVIEPAILTSTTNKFIICRRACSTSFYSIFIVKGNLVSVSYSNISLPQKYQAKFPPIKKFSPNNSVKTDYTASLMSKPWRRIPHLPPHHQIWHTQNRINASLSHVFDGDDLVASPGSIGMDSSIVLVNIEMS